MKHLIWILFGLFLSACHTTQAPTDFTYTEVQTSSFKFAAWQKITDEKAPLKIYIEGDGYAFNRYGMPSSDPTPHSRFWQSAAFSDPSSNVIYLGRACQYVDDTSCQTADWTTARFSKKAVDGTYEAILQMAGNRPIILIGYSGGAQIAGLTAVLHPDLNIRKLITVAGNLDHSGWTRLKNLKPLDGSLDLNDYRAAFLKLDSLHFIGDKDAVIPRPISEQFIADPARIVVVPNATHSSGWENTLRKIYRLP